MVDAIPITGTFLDEISLDIPSQNWDHEKWDLDFQAMKAIGIDTVIMIRCGVWKWMTYPSRAMQDMCKGFTPPVDLVKTFLELSEKHGLKFYFGLCDGGYWQQKEYEKELALNFRVAEEAQKLYGDFSAFHGWYITWEVSRNHDGLIKLLSQMGQHCKQLSGGKPVMISPYVEGCKDGLTKSNITLEEHEKHWDEIMSGIAGSIDIVAFQDGHVEFDELEDFLVVNGKLAKKYGLKNWTNTETFDRDMPIKFLPIKWEKLLLKLQAAKRAGMEKSITFEFSHFLSPYSCYLQARNLFDIYCEYFGCKNIVVRDAVNTVLEK